MCDRLGGDDTMAGIHRPGRTRVRARPPALPGRDVIAGESVDGPRSEDEHRAKRVSERSARLSCARRAATLASRAGDARLQAQVIRVAVDREMLASRDGAKSPRRVGRCGGLPVRRSGLAPLGRIRK